MANALVDHFRRSAPRETQGRSDAELTGIIANHFATQGTLDGYRKAYPDFEADLLNTRNEGGDVWAETVAGGKAGLLDRLPGTLQSAAALGADALAREETVKNLGLEGPVQKAGDYLRGLAAQNRQEADDRMKEAGGRTIARVEDIRPTSARDYVLWALPTFAENAPSMLGSLAAGAATGLVTKNPLAALAATGAASVAQNVGDVYGDLNEDPSIPREKAINAALGAGIPMGVLDMASELLPLAKLSGLFKGAPKNAVLKSIMDVMNRGGIAARMAKGAAGGVLSEGPTEMAQELIQIAGEEYATGKKVPDDVVRSRVINAGAGGAIVGGVAGGAFGMLPHAADDGTTGRQDSSAADLAKVAAARGLTPEQYAANSASTADLVETPPDAAPKIEVAPSAIQGQGVIATAPIAVGEVISPATIGGGRTEAGRFVNHNPDAAANASLVATGAGNIDIVAKASIKAGEEVTVDYRGADPLSGLGETVEPGGATPVDAALRPRPNALAGLGETVVPEGETPVDQALAANPKPSPAAAVPVSPSPGSGEILPAGQAAPVAAGVLPAIADHAPAIGAIRKATSKSKEGGVYGIALEKDGRVEVRNVYRAVDKATGAEVVMVENADTKGGGRRLDAILKDGWTVRKQPWMFAQPTPNVRLTLAAAEFDTQHAAMQAASDDVLSAINDQRGDRVIEAALQSQPKVLAAVRHLAGVVAQWAAINPEKALAALGTRVDSVAARDSMRAAATLKKLAAGEVLRQSGGKIFGIFTEAQWDVFQGAVEAGKGDEALITHFGEGTKGASAAYAWAKKMGDIGTDEKMREAKTSSLDASENLANDLAQQADETAQPEETATGAGAARAALLESDFDDNAIHAALSELSTISAANDGELTATDVQDVITSLEEGRPFLKFLKRSGPSKARGILERTIQNLLTLHDEANGTRGKRSVGARADAKSAGVSRGISGGQSESVVAPGKTLRSQPESEPRSRYRADPGRVAQAWGVVVATLRDAGIDVSAVQAAAQQVDDFYQQTGGRTDARSFIELVLKDLTAPSTTDLEVAVHEAVHVLFAAVPMEVREAIHRAVAKLPEPDATTNRSLQNADPEVRAQERLAVLLQGEGFEAGVAKDFGSRVVRFFKDLYLRTAAILARVFGLGETADAFALRYFRNRLDALLQGDYAPQSLINALGGRPLTWSEKAVMLPGIGASVGRVLNGQMAWAPKVPDTAEALAYNLDLAFSRPMDPKPVSFLARVGQWLGQLAGPEHFQFPKDGLPKSKDLAEVAAALPGGLRVVHASRLGYFLQADRAFKAGDEVLVEIDGYMVPADFKREVGGKQVVQPAGPRYGSLGEIAVDKARVADPALMISVLNEGGAPGRFAIDSSKDEAGRSSASRKSAAIYQAIYRWAANNGFKIVPDTSTSPDGNYRRTSHQLSSALREGSAEHFEPTKDQLGRMELTSLDDWRALNFEEKVGALAKAEVAYVGERMPALDTYDYIWGKDQILDARRNPISADRLGEAVDRFHRDSITDGARESERVGGATARRYLAARALLREKQGLSGVHRVVTDNLGQLLYSRPDPAAAINRDVATLNHAIETEQAAVAALAVAPKLGKVVAAAASGGLDIARWLRGQFRFEDPAALKAAALARLDPATGAPVAGVNPAMSLSGLTDPSNAGPAKIHAYQAAYSRLKVMSGGLTSLRSDLASAVNRKARAQQSFLEAHRNYLSAEGLTKIVMQGVRQLIARERQLGLRTGERAGTVMQQLRELDVRAAETIDREYAHVFNKLFRGTELSGRNLFDLLDQLANEAGIDFRGLKITDIRQKIAQRVGAGMGSADLGLLINDTPSSRALLATVVAYGKTHPEVLLQIERRRVKNAVERIELQVKLDKLIAECGITNQAVTDLPKTAKLEERARVFYALAKKRDAAMTAGADALEQRIAAAEAALPVYAAAVEALRKDLGFRPDYIFGDGMKYRVPVTGPKGTTLAERTLRLDSTQGVTDRAQLERDLVAMTDWLAMKEATGERDADYSDLLAARQALLEGGYFESDVRKTSTWVRSNVFMPVGDKAAATGLPSGRIAQQMINHFSSIENELRSKAQTMGDRNNRLRDAAVAVLNRGRKTADMTADRYYSEVAEPAMSMVEKARDLLELGLSREQVLSRAFQRVINHLLTNSATEGFVRGKEAAVAAAVRAHLEALESTGKFFVDTNTRHGVGVRDARVIVARGDGVEAAGIREALPVGAMTFSRKASALLGRVYRLMRSQGWGGFKELVATAEETYRTKGADGLRAALAPYLTPAIIDDYVGAMAMTESYSVFDAPVLPDGVTRAEADPVRTAQAWRESGGDVVAFIEKMYDAHSGTTDRATYAADMLGRLQTYWAHLSEMLPGDETGMTPNGLARLTSNRMIDARTLDRWPTAWTDYNFFDPHSNHAIAREVAAQVAFGRETNRFAEVWGGMEKEMDGLKAAHDAIVAREQKLGFTGKKLKARVKADYVTRLGAKGAAEYARVERIAQLRPAIAEAKDSIRAFFSSKHNQLDAVRFASQVGQVISFGMLNNPGTALVNLADLFAPVAQGGVSGVTLKQVARNWVHLGEGVAGSLGQALGLDLMKSSRLQNLYVEMGLNDPATALQYIGKTEDGLRSDITADQAARGREESNVTKALRLFQRTVGFGVTPLGEKSRFTALRPLAPFQQFVHETMRASTLSAWQRVEDMVLRGIEHLNANPAAAVDPNFKLTADELGLKGAEHAAFEAFRIKLAEGYGLELTALTREAMTRMAGPRAQNELLTRTSRALIQGMVANELILEGNLATMTPKAWTSSAARLVLPLWGWPIRRALQVARIGLDPQEKFRMAVLGRGVMALGVMAGAGLAMSMLADEYHERIVGRKRNLRSVKSLPDALAHGQLGEAFMGLMENVNRAGTFGLWGELLNTGLNAASGGGDNRALSFDQRVVMMNSMLSVARSIQNVVAQHDVDYSGVVRPLVMALGGNSALQYLQVGNNALGLDNAEARLVERVDTQNRLRVAGREIGLEVRGGVHVSATPTPLTPLISRMVLAVYAGDRADFLSNWREAVREAQRIGQADPVAYVRDNFASRNPLKNVFQHLSQDDYFRLLRSMDARGQAEVRSAVNRFNAYAESLDARAYTGAVRPRLVGRRN